MCGIAGIISLDGRTWVDRGRLERMRDALAHRGPDGEGAWVDGPVGLGHRRLAIVDVAGGHQPMSSADGGAWLTFNGEIYNHLVLRRALEPLGHRYRTRCDTETILHAYDEYGEGVVDRLQGMFAFAIWDAKARRLMLARDRLGIKPLYYAQTDTELLFASEIKALINAGIRPELNESVIPEFLATRFVSGDETFYKGIRKLLPGHLLTWSAGAGLQTRRYWSLSPTTAPDDASSLETAAIDLRERLRAAVERHLMSDVPLGVFLSGGLDSSALAALAAGMTDEPLRTFAVGFSEAEANELPHARLVARHIGADHREVVVTPDEFFESLPRLIWQEDEPIAFTSSVPLFHVSRLARDHVKVVLTGEGADELFLGYNRYRVASLNARLGHPYAAWVPRLLRAAVRGLAAHLPRVVRRYSSRSFLAMESGERAWFFDNFAVFPERLQRSLVAPDLVAARDPYAAGLRCYAACDGDLLARMSHADLQTYLLELLMKQDQMSMAASIESRVPFLDDELVSHVSALPSRFKLQGWRTKAILREAVRDLLPPEILSRRKMGFPVPVGRWLRQSFGAVVDAFVLSARARERRFFNPLAVKQLVDEHQSGFADHGDRLWLLINFELWQRMVCEGEDVADVMRPVWRRLKVPNARALDQDGRPVAAEHGRAAAHLPHPLGTRRAS